MPKRNEERRDRRGRRDDVYPEQDFNEPSKSGSNDFKQPPKSRVEVHQPTTEVWDYENHWQNDFIDCCSDCKLCACAFFCTPCFVRYDFECIFDYEITFNIIKNNILRCLNYLRELVNAVVCV